jgi:hypothetical protein
MVIDLKNILREPLIKPTNDLFIASLLSPPKNKAILVSAINSVLNDFRQPSIVEATVLNPFNILETVAGQAFGYRPLSNRSLAGLLAYWRGKISIGFSRLSRR